MATRSPVDNNLSNILPEALAATSRNRCWKTRRRGCAQSVARLAQHTGTLAEELAHEVVDECGKDVLRDGDHPPAIQVVIVHLDSQRSSMKQYVIVHLELSVFVN